MLLSDDLHAVQRLASERMPEPTRGGIEIEWRCCINRRKWKKQIRKGKREGGGIEEGS